jgi:DNA polymerase-3 subunit gamma/tau
MSTSLKGLVRSKPEETPPLLPAETEDETETESPQQVVSLDVGDLIRCWDAYAETLKEKIHLKNTMLSCKPVLQEEEAHFEVAVLNPGQRDELITNSLALLNVLRIQLKNNRIQMHIRIEETHEKKRAYTAGEKYVHFAQLNPLLVRLKDEFDLSLD